MSSSGNVKEQVKELVDQLPEDVSWDEVLDKVRVRRLIEKGLRDAQAGRTTILDDVRKQFGLEPL
jgi:hypothetical protein